MAPTCFELLDRHVVGGGADDLALRAGDLAWSYARLLEEVAAFGGALRHCGVVAADTVAVALPDSPEAVVAVLACARIGAVHDLAAAAAAKVLVTSGSGPVEDTGAEVVIVKQAPDARAALREGRDYDWDVAVRAGRTDPAACEADTTITPYDGRTERLLAPLVGGGTIELDQG